MYLISTWNGSEWEPQLTTRDYMAAIRLSMDEDFKVTPC